MAAVTPEIESRVRAGAKALDEYIDNWADRICTTELNMYYDNQCILGQLYGDFDAGLDAFGWDLHAAYAYGFYVFGDEWDSVACEYDALTKAWKDEIARRRTASRAA